MIWGLGLPKTGTTSLSQAVWALHPKDLRMAHSDPKVNTQLGYMIDEGLATSGIPSQFCGACEMPVVRQRFKEIDAQDPDAKFILTVRTLDSWLDSMESHKKLNSDRRLWPIFDNTRTQLAKHFTRYHVDIFDYFRDQDNLMVMNITADPGHVNWAKLEAFLDWSRVDGQMKFPHKNPTPNE